MQQKGGRSPLASDLQPVVLLQHILAPLLLAEAVQELHQQLAVHADVDAVDRVLRRHHQNLHAVSSVECESIVTQ